MPDAPKNDHSRRTLEDLLGLLPAATQDESVAIFSELVSRFEPVVKKAWWKTRHVEYPEFVNEVFERALEALPRLRQPKAFPLFFRRVVESVAGDLMRQAMKEPVALEAVAEIVSAVEAEITVPLIVRSYLEHVGEREQLLLELEYIYGFTTEEVARRMRMKPGSVRKMKSRALEILRAVVDRDRRMLERLQKK